ncbi:cytochrome P450 [Trichoderma sp. SZMC 28012]
MAIISIVATFFMGLVMIYGLKLLLDLRKAHGSPLPPGPKPLPILGNIADLPSAGVKDWEHWLKHKDCYGPISSVTVFGTTIIILNSSKAAIDLLDKRGSIYSGRPRLIFGLEMCGWSNLVSGQSYTPKFRAYRQKMHQAIGSSSALSRYHPMLEAEVNRFLFLVLRAPQNLLQHIRTEAGAIILKMTYGYTIDPEGPDPMVELADRAMEQFAQAVIPGAWMVDTLPILRYLPEWLPGAGFRKTAKEWHQTLMETAARPMEFVKTQLARGESEECFVANEYQKTGGEMSEDDEYILKWSAASMYAGGADTSVSTLQTFFLAMTIHPEVQEKARQEIDVVVGTGKIPTLDDRPSLPYVEAVVKEALRWHPTAPMGLPHTVTADDTYEGYFIPKGAMLLANIWFFLHDPDVYKDPMMFNPERFVSPACEPDPQLYVFGFGRRICPGKAFADASVWLTIAKCLATLDIKKGVENGQEINPVIDFDSGVVSHSVPFKASITARSPEHKELVFELENKQQRKNSKEALQRFLTDDNDLMI